MIKKETPPKADCKAVMDHICLSLGEDLNSKRCIAIKNHLSTCLSCQRYFDSVEKTIEFYKKYNISFPEEAHNRLIEMLGLEK